MNTLRIARIVLALTAVAVRADGQTLARGAWDNEALARRIVRSLALEPGEAVVLLGHPQFATELVPPLRLEIVRHGGVDLGLLQVLSHPWPAGPDGDALRSSAAAARAAYRRMFEGVDAAVMLPGATSDHPAYQAFQDLLRQGRGRVIHFHWDANGAVMTLPGQPVPPTYEVDRVFQRAVLEVDYDDLARRQRAFVRAMRTAEIRVATPAGTDLRFRIGDRPVNVQDGDASPSRASQARMLVDREIELPAGVIRVAPLEETVQGTIVFPLSSWSGREVKDLRLTFRNGGIVDIATTDGADAVRGELESAGPDAWRFREFALGFNPLLAVPERDRWIPYYGYGAGVVRLSLGNNLELGGTVGGEYVRWNFFADGSVWVGDTQWVDHGRLMDVDASR